ncbi:MAG: phosphoribosylformylglycinamidine synthase subunit PurL [Planctomycetales bacterium]|nr:phosphoribosylformylglycinamidine synthase subunit PurL [Planctomycetales bacterium]
MSISAAHGFLLQGDLSAEQVQRAADLLLADSITESTTIAEVGDGILNLAPSNIAFRHLVHVLPKPGVMDPVALSTLQALQDMGLPVEHVSTFRKYWISELEAIDLQRLCQKLLFNDSIERVVIGALNLERLDVGTEYQFELIQVPIRKLDADGLQKLSREGQLYLTLAEMQTIQEHFRFLQRDPTDIELETIAQTWSEHCSHKTLAGRIAYEDGTQSIQFDNMLKETIFAATQRIRRDLGEHDWCVKVFSDNAGVVKFDNDYHVVFKVETHNHPSAIEPYGGANTGIGGVIRDPMGTGLGAKPFCNTDIFCFAPPNVDADSLPPGVLHPRRVMKGVIAGVRDYGNRMGIPTVNGAIYFDPRYLGNPLVYCGNAGLLPVDKVEKSPQPGDWIVTVGGRTGRDGIHGATFSSAELTSESESISGGAVQIGNAVTEKMVLDVLLQARDEGLYSAVTDCGAGGFSSAVGEMGEHLGAEVWLDKAPLKYDGLSYTEIWISEAQERMVFAVPPKHLERLQAICNAEGVEVNVIGQFVETGNLRLMYQQHEVGVLSMDFLHGGRPPVVRSAVYTPVPQSPLALPLMDPSQLESTLVEILGSLNVASKHWIIRQYDHEVLAGSVVKPLVGPACDGPSDAAVVRPRVDSNQAVVISCGMNPYYGDLDPYHMAASAIDEAVRNAVAVGADPERIAILDNFCWGNTDRPETLGSLVRAALACHDVALAWKTPFISGKDSLNNEFAWLDSDGIKRSIAIPPSLLISAMGQMEDASQAITMDLKDVGSSLFIVGRTKSELGGSHLSLVKNLAGGQVPQVDLIEAKDIFRSLHQALRSGAVRACHDLSEGGLAVAISEMAFAGQLGVTIDIANLPRGDVELSSTEALFSESNTRFLIEVTAGREAEVSALLEAIPHANLGKVTGLDEFQVKCRGEILIQSTWRKLRDSWIAPLDWA